MYWSAYPDPPLPTTAAILSGFRELVKILRTLPCPTTTGQHHPSRATTDQAPRPMRLRVAERTATAVQNGRHSDSPAGARFWTSVGVAQHTWLRRLGALVYKYGDVFSGRTEYRSPLRDGPPGLLKGKRIRKSIYEMLHLDVALLSATRRGADRAAP